MNYYLNTLKKVWIFITIIVSLFVFFFEGNRIINFFLGDYSKQLMKVKSISFSSISGNTEFANVTGYLGGDNVYIILHDKDIKSLYAYINDLKNDNSTMINYNDMSTLNFFLPIIKFKSSRKVIMIPKHQKITSTVTKWFLGNLLILSLTYFPMIIIIILNKQTSKL